MTPLLEKAVARVTQLSEPDQDVIAALIMEELASEERWARAFADSAEALSALAREALSEHKAGKTQPLDLDAP